MYYYATLANCPVRVETPALKLALNAVNAVVFNLLAVMLECVD